jgi:hypothetical protein
MNRRRAPLLIAAVAAVVLGAAEARAQAVPLVEGSVAPSVGVESIGPPGVVVDVGLGRRALFQPVLQARASAHARTLAVAGGGAWQQELGDVVFLRETVLAGPFLAAVDGVVPGARASAQLLVGFRLGDRWVLSVGPEVTAAVAVADVPVPADGRVGVALVGGARWFVVPDVAVTLSLGGGYDLGGHGAGAVAGQAFAGALFRFGDP